MTEEMPREEKVQQAATDAGDRHLLSRNGSSPGASRGSVWICSDDEPEVLLEFDEPLESQSAGCGFALLVVPLVLLWIKVALAIPADSLWGEIRERQFVNCFVVWPTLIGFLAILLAETWVACRHGVSPWAAVGRHRFVFLLLPLLLLIVGATLMETQSLSHAWFRWCTMCRVKIMLSNVGRVVAISSIFTIPFVLRVRGDRTGRVGLWAALTVWSYLFAGAVKILWGTSGIE